MEEVIETLDLFSHLSPEEISGIIKYAKFPISGRTMDQKEIQNHKDALAKVPPEEKARRAKELNSPENKQKALHTRLNNTTYEILTRERKKHFRVMPEDEREAHRKPWSILSPQEKKEWLDKSFHRQEAQDRSHESFRKYIKSRTPEQIKERVKALREAGRKTFKVTFPEILMGMYLEVVEPGLWAYNGQGQQLLEVGYRIPDLVKIDRKEVIEVFGSYYHQNDITKEEQIIDFYKEKGIKCTIIWEDEVYRLVPQDLLKEYNKLEDSLEKEMENK